MADPTTTLHVTGAAVGGDGVARDSSGRVVLVAGGLPGERVRAEIVAEHRNHARAVVTEVLEPAAGRVSPPCPFVASGCGGCGWQHVDPDLQRRLKVAMVVDALRRLGGVDEPAVDEGPDLPVTAYRTTLHCVADDAGRLSLHRRHSHELVAVPGCRVAHPLVVEVLAEGRFPPGAEVTVRVGARTGERLVVVDPAVGGPVSAGPGSADAGGSGSPVPASGGPASGGPASGGPASAGPGSVGGGDGRGRATLAEAGAAHDGAPLLVPEGVRVVGGDELAAGRRAWLHEEVAGRRLRVSARSFFQASPEGAEALAAAVAAALGDVLAGGGRLVDLYGGVGLFGVTVGGAGPVTVVESSPSATADARVNLADRDARVVRSEVARWRPRRAAAVAADPPRAGLARTGVRVVAGTGARRLALVSCDAGSLGRDTALLRRAGYRYVGATLVDQFAGTPHVEVVARFDRT
jgi:tRNA/tmRNA/rRNA uracil-C5-methylase (TrmA/RlmC/RlmD family)